MKKILILTAGFGDGHNAAARSLRDAIELLDEDARAEVLDLFADSYGAFNTFAEKPTSASCNTPQTVGQFIRCWKIRSSKSSSAVSRACKTRSKKSWPKRSRIASSPPTRSTATSSKKFTPATTSARSVSSPSSPIPSPSTPRGSARRAIFSAWPTTSHGGSAEKRRRAGTNQGARLSRQPAFRGKSERPAAPVGDEPRRVLYVINTGKKKAGKAIDRLLEIDDVHLTITAGRDPNCARS
jgi:processive 1,2-diacylglycerol beta-glucosyltransferase